MSAITCSFRPFVAGDLPALYRICLQTGDAGADASSQYRDPELLGHYYAAPYGLFAPATALVLVAAAEVVGYIVGCADSLAFQRWMETEWLPPLRTRYPLPPAGDASADAAMVRLLHEGYAAPAQFVGAYPAHLHIDLLPRAQGQGCGRALMAAFLEGLRLQRCPGVHLGVSARNSGAHAFYERVGFSCLETLAWGKWYGLRL